MSDTTSIFQFEDYREWLSAEINTRVQNNSQGSVNAFASRVKMSQSLLSLILRGKRKLTIKRAEPIADYLELNERERKYLRLMLQLERVISPSTRDATLREMVEIVSNPSDDLTAHSRGSERKDWVLAACDLKTVPRTVAGIASFLGLPEADVGKILESLLDEDLVSEKGGEYTLVRYQKLPRVIAADPKQIESVLDRLQAVHAEFMDLLRKGERSVLIDLSLDLRKSKGFLAH